MEKVRYMISDAANMVQVEQHVLRYWEEELQLDIPRTKMGHRYYTDENINELLKVKELKEKGYQLKAIRMYLKRERQHKLKEKEQEKEALEQIAPGGQFVTMTNARELGLSQSIEPTREIKMEQFQSLMTEIVRVALENNNEALSTQVGDHILKEMNYLMRENDQLAEDRYRRLDAVIRGKKVKMQSEKKKHSLFGKGNKKGTS